MIRCPNCNHEFEEESRAPDGAGTQSAKNMAVLTPNLMSILSFFLRVDSSQKYTIHELTHFINECNIQRKGKRSGGKWNYHDIQSSISKLLALELVWVNGKQGQKPLYSVSPYKAASVLNNGGRLK